MKSLTEQIIENIIPKSRDFLTPDQLVNDGWNKCRTETIKVIPEILSLIRGEVDSIKRFRCGACDGARCSHCQFCEFRTDLLEKLK